MREPYWDSVTVGLVLPNLAIDLGSMEGVEAKLLASGDRIVASISLPSTYSPAEFRIHGSLGEGILRMPYNASPSKDREFLRKLDELMRRYRILAYQGRFQEHPFNDRSWRL